MNDYRLIVRAFGGADRIERESFDPGQPTTGEVRVRHTAIGVNFIDTYHREGLYPQNLPLTLGVEAAGIIDAVGDDVTGFKLGQRVAYATSKPGSYATRRIIAADQIIRLPDSIGDELAAASMLKGMTAEFLIFRCARIEPGQVALVHAAAGGVGVILVQWLSALGVRVIAHAGSQEKAAIARAAGAETALDGGFEDLASRVRGLTDGVGVDVCFDGVGAASWATSLASLRKRGLMISFGNASGPVPPISVLDLSRGGSLFLTRPTLFDYIATPSERQELSGRLFEALASGIVKIEIGQRFPLDRAVDAHRAMEGRKTTGSTILTI